jgi:hypothetical protein
MSDSSWSWSFSFLVFATVNRVVVPPLRLLPDRVLFFFVSFFLVDSLCNRLLTRVYVSLAESWSWFSVACLFLRVVFSWGFSCKTLT